MAFGSAQGSGRGFAKPFESSSNTTTAHPGSRATYTGTLEPALANGVTVSCQSSSSSSRTLYFDFSPDTNAASINLRFDLNQYARS